MLMFLPEPQNSDQNIKINTTAECFKINNHKNMRINIFRI